MCKYPLNWANSPHFYLLFSYGCTLVLQERSLFLSSVKICPRTWPKFTLSFFPSYLSWIIKQRDPNLQGFERTWRKTTVVAGELVLPWLGTDRCLT